MVKVSHKYHIRKTGVGKLRVRHNPGCEWSGLRNSMLYARNWVEEAWCSRCQKDTQHKIEDIQVGEYGRAMDREFTCLKCGHKHIIEDINTPTGDELWERATER